MDPESKAIHLFREILWETVMDSTFSILVQEMQIQRTDDEQKDEIGMSLS